MSNLDKYRKDLESLIKEGEELFNAIQFECMPDEFEEAFKMNKLSPEKIKEFKKSIPSFKDRYQSWYSETQILIKQLLPDRLSDFIKHYEKPKSRKAISYANYTIEDYLQGLHITRGWEKEKIVGPDAAIPQFRQQLAILKSVQKRFESSLFDIKQLVQANLFDSELEAAKELSKNGFIRAAGAIAGVVLEKHLHQVCLNHNLAITKKAPGISDFNDLLKNTEVIDIASWRSIQYLADLRNLCDHDKKKEPTESQIEDLISGVDKTTKTLF